MISSSWSVPDFGFGKAFSLIQWATAREPRGGADKSNEKADGKAESADKSETTPKGEVTPSDQATIVALQQIDRRVRAHESAHLSSGAGVVRGGASFTYTRGPDGKNYAVGGDVPIDASPGRTPEDTLIKAATIQRAALAPADPSPQDLRVAAQAQQMAAEASLELARQKSVSGSGQAAAVDFYRRVERDDRNPTDIASLLAIA